MYVRVRYLQASATSTSNRCATCNVSSSIRCICAAVTSVRCNFGSAAFERVVRNTLRKSVSPIPGLMLCGVGDTQPEPNKQRNEQHKKAVTTCGIFVNASIAHRHIDGDDNGMAAPVDADRRCTVQQWAHRGCDDPERWRTSLIVQTQSGTTDENVKMHIPYTQFGFFPR